MKKKSDTPRELEVSFIIISGDPKDTFEHLVGLKLAGNYRLLPRSSQNIHDIYFDTKEEALKSAHASLRIRNVNNNSLITLKGAPDFTDWGGTDRPEIENNWSKTALERIEQELNQLKIPFAPAEKFYSQKPVEMLEHMGFQIIQNRQTVRQLRHVVDPGEEDSPLLAEFALDCVTYHFENLAVHHREIEIEAKADGNEIILKAIVDDLLESFPGKLRPWIYSKLATGKAVEQMARAGILENLLDSGRNLVGTAYEIIENYLSGKIREFPHPNSF